MSSAARTAPTRGSPTTPAATGIARSASGGRRGWLAAREAELLPVPYFHVVFTLPAAIGAIAYQNKAKVYGLLFKAAAETLTTIAADPKHLGAGSASPPCCTPGGRTSITIPTSTASCRAAASPPTASAGFAAGRASSCRCACCRVCSGGCSCEGLERCIRCRRAAVLHRSAPARQSRSAFKPISRRCAGRMGGLCQASVRRPDAGARLSRPLHPSRRHRQQPADLARPTARSASAGRTIARTATSKVDDARAGEFIRRFLLHVLPDGFHRIRHYGLFANGHRADKIAALPQASRRVILASNATTAIIRTSDSGQPSRHLVHAAAAE